MKQALGIVGAQLCPAAPKPQGMALRYLSHSGNR